MAITPIFPLHHLEVASRRYLHRDPNHFATRYLQDHPWGFQRIQYLKGNDFLSVFPDLLAFQVYADGPDSSIGLFYRYHNKGTLNHLESYHASIQSPVPEYFIWHVIAQLGRAYCSLHTGRLIPEDPVRASLLRHLTRDSTEPLWRRPVIHNNGHTSNIFLHVPTPQEKMENPLLARFSDALPQVILGDFSQAYEGANSRDVHALAQGMSDSDWETWRDKAFFGSAIKDLMFAAMSSDAMAAYYAEVYSPAMGYSEQLVAVVRRFEPLVQMMEEAEGLAGPLRLQDFGAGRDTWPGDGWMFGEMIEMADWFVGEFVGKQGCV
ncbi:hypothetical protein B0T16DRAFT_387723 [Cercophora newfieldiana]|uniref:Uncharacterized protein n=1 Tax=Cercophora newfieldiana TaxID=92897 RepID=A0AA39YJ63_9PEZI|nr:hypothetical protein B0T16DRAFT_387723 [Cercophora newfieldiana]